MDRVTLPKVVHKVELEDEPDIVRRASVPAGQSLPAWEHIPLDSKFPMIPAPRGSVVLATTDLSQPKYCATKEHDFDLTDPNAFVMSSDYSALHDPHLKAHFSSMYMRKHLIRNGFITAEGQVVCSLREFNEYRRYLRKLCLLELAREKRMKEKEASGTVDEKVEEKEGKVIQDLRQRIREQEIAQRQKLVNSMAESAKRLEKRKKDMLDKQLQREIKRKQYEDKRRQILSQIRKSERTKSSRLMEKWEIEDRKRQERLEIMRKQQIKSQQQKIISKWNERKRFQQNRLANEAERRDEIDKDKHHRVERRKNKMKMHWQKQTEQLNDLRNKSAQKRQVTKQKYERRMTIMMSGDGGRRSKRSALQSPFQSMWVVEKVLRRLSFPDIYSRVTAEDSGGDNELWDFLDGIIKQAVNVLKTEAGPDELDILKEGAQALVMRAIDGITQETVPEILICVDETSPEPPEEPPIELIGEQHKTPSQEQAGEPVEGMPPIQDRDDQTEGVTHVILMDEDVASRSEEAIVPAPSPDIPEEVSSPQLTQSALEIHGVNLNILRHSMIRMDKILPDNAVLDTKTALSGLNLLLDDIAIDRCSRQELEMIVGYAAPRHGWWDSGTNNIVEIMLKSILSELRTGNVNNEGLTRLILSVVGVPVHELPEEPDNIKDFLPAILHNIMEQYTSNNVNDDQVQCMSAAITGLFLDPDLDIAGTVVSDILERLIKGVAGTSKQKRASTAICKIIIGKILKHVAYFMSDCDDNGSTSEQVANALVSETMLLLADMLSDKETTPKDAVGSSIIAEWIVSQVLNNLAQHGAIHHTEMDESDSNSETTTAAKAVVNDILSSLKSQMVGTEPQVSANQDTPLIMSDVVLNVVKYMTDPTAFQSRTLDLEVPDMAMAIAGKTFIQLAEIVSSTSTGISGPEESDYLFAKTLVADTFREFAHRVMPGKHQNKTSPLENKLTAQVIEDAGQFRVVSSVICENLLKHESSAVAQQILLETLKQLTRLLEGTHESKKSKKCTKLVSGSLRALAMTGQDDSTSASTSSVVTRIVNETLKGLRGSAAEPNGKRKEKYTGGPGSVNNIVFNTLNAILDMTKEIFTTSELEACTVEFESLAKNMICETFHKTIEVLLSGNPDITVDRRGSAKSDMDEKLICETMRHLVKSLLLSTAVVQDNMDLNICFAASQIVRQTLQQLSEKMIRSVPYTHPDNMSATHVQVTEGILKMAKAISEGSMSIGDKQNLTLPFESKKLVNVITDNVINSTDAFVSTEALDVLSYTLKETAYTIFESLANTDEPYSDTLVLAGRMVHDILNEIASFVSSATTKFTPCDSTNEHQAIVEDVIEKILKWAAGWPGVATRDTVYDLSGCAIIAGDIVKHFLTELAKESFFSQTALSDASHEFVSTLAVCDILSRFSFAASVIVENNLDLFENSGLGKETDRDIVKHLLQQIQDNHLSLQELTSLAETIVPVYRIVTFPTLSKSNSVALVEFITDLLKTFCTEVDTCKYTYTDLDEIRDSLFQEYQERTIQRRFADLGISENINIRQLVERVMGGVNSGELKQSEIDRIARYMLRNDGTLNLSMEHDSLDMTKQESDKVMNDIIQKNKNKLSSGKMVKNEMKRNIIHIVEACALQSPNGNEAEIPVANIMSTINSVTHLNSLISDIEDGVFACYEICRLAYAVVSSASGKDPVLSVSEVSAQGVNATLASVILDQLMEVLLCIKDESTGPAMVTRLSAVMLAKNASEPLSKELIDPLAWTGVTELLLNTIRSVSERLLSKISDLISFGTIQVVCDDTHWSRSYTPSRNQPKLQLQEIDRVLLDRFVKSTLEVISHRQTASGSKIDTAALKKRSKSRVVDASKTRAILVTLSKSYRNLEEVIFHPLSTVKQNVGISVQKAILQLIHDIDYKILPVGDVDSLETTLLQWWNDNKANYEYVASDDAMKLVSSLIDKIKSQSRVIGPPRRHELFAMVRITEEKVRSFVEEAQREEPEILTVVSKQALLTPCTSIANQLVQTVLNALENDTWIEDEAEEDRLRDKDMGSCDSIASDVVRSLLSRLDSKFVNDLAEDITNYLLEKVKTNEGSETSQSTLTPSEKEIIPVERVKSVLQNVPIDVKPVSSLQVSPPIAAVSSMMANNLVLAITDQLQTESTTSWTADLFVNSFLNKLTTDDLLNVSSLDISPSELAQQTVDLALNKILKEGISDDAVLARKVTASITPSELAGKIVDSTIKVLLSSDQSSVSNMSVCQIKETDSLKIDVSLNALESKERPSKKSLKQHKSGSRTQSKPASSKSISSSGEKTNVSKSSVRSETLKSKLSLSKERQEIIYQNPVERGDHSAKMSALSFKKESLVEQTLTDGKSGSTHGSQTVTKSMSDRQSLSQILKETQQQSESTTLTSQASVIAAQAAESLAKILENKSIEPSKIESYCQKAEEGDPVLVDVIEKASNISPSESLTEQVVQMILAALNNESHTESENSQAPSAKPSLAAKVVTSIMKLVDRCSPDDFPLKSKSVSSAVYGLVDTVEKDIEKTSGQLQTDNSAVIDRIPSAPRGSSRFPTTLDRIREILQQIIQDVSASRLTKDQIEDIASSAAGEMVKKFSFQPISNVQSPSSLRVIATLQSIIRDIDNGHFSLEDVHNAQSNNLEIHQVETDQSEHHPGSTAVIDTNKKENMNNSTDKGKEPNESTSNIIKDILKGVLSRIQSNRQTLSASQGQDISTGNEDVQSYKLERIRSWILESRVYCDDSHLVHSIAEESVNKTIENLNEGKISDSECRLIADAIFKKLPEKRIPEDTDDNVRSFVVSTLEDTLRRIQKEGLTSETIDSLVKAVLQVILRDRDKSSSSPNKESPSASKRNNVVRFLSKILSHLLTVTRSASGDAECDTGTEKDSLMPVVLSEDHPDGSEMSLDQASVQITPNIGGRELHVDTKTAGKALSTISIRGGHGLVNPHDPLARNSFRNLHKPDLARTEALSHGKPEDLEAKLQEVAEENVHLVHSEDDGELTIIAKVPSSRTCSSSSQSRSPSADLDGTLENVISLILPADEAPAEIQVSEKSSVIHSNTNANSPRPPKGKSPPKIKVMQARDRSPRKTTKVDNNKHPVSKNKYPEEAKSPTTVSSVKTIAKTSPTQSKVSIQNGSSQSSSKLRKLKSPSTSKNNLKQKKNVKRTSSSTPDKAEAQFAVDSNKTMEDQQERSREPVLVQSLCGSHSTCVTVRDVDNDRSSVAKTLSS